MKVYKGLLHKCHVGNQPDHVCAHRDAKTDEAKCNNVRSSAAPSSGAYRFSKGTFRNNRGTLSVSCIDVLCSRTGFSPTLPTLIDPSEGILATGAANVGRAAQAAAEADKGECCDVFRTRHVSFGAHTP